MTETNDHDHDDATEGVVAYDPKTSPARAVLWPRLYVGRWASIEPGVTRWEIREADERLDTVRHNLAVERENDDPPADGQVVVYEYTEYVPRERLTAALAEVERLTKDKDALARRLIEVQR